MRPRLLHDRRDKEHVGYSGYRYLPIITAAAIIHSPKGCRRKVPPLPTDEEAPETIIPSHGF
jgi:hypothetical protein